MTENLINDLLTNRNAQIDEALRIVTCLKFYIKDKSLRARAVNFVRKHRKELLPPSDFVNKIYVNKYKGSDSQMILLSNLLENSPQQKFYVAEFRKYSKYCEDFFRIAGLYSLEDPYVRRYFFSAFGDKQSFWSSKDRKAMTDAMLKIFSEKELVRLAKRLSNKKSIISKDTKKAVVFYLRTTRTSDKSFRSIAQEVGIDKNTAQAYYNEVRDMSDFERVEFLKANPPEDFKSLEVFQNHDDFDGEDTPL